MKNIFTLFNNYYHSSDKYFVEEEEPFTQEPFTQEYSWGNDGIVGDWWSHFEEEFAFVNGLSLEQKDNIGSKDNLNYIKEQLINDYCFPWFEISDARFDIILILPEGYSIIKKEYLLEILKYYTAAGVGVKVGTLKEDGNVYLEGVVHDIKIEGILL